MAANLQTTLFLFGTFLYLVAAVNPLQLQSNGVKGIPMIINTWPFTDATNKAWQVLQETNSAVQSVVAGCTVCEKERCDMSVGYGGSPDERGETTLDAIVMNGDTLDIGAVGGLRRVKGAVKVAHRVLEHTSHSILVGDQAEVFAVSMGLPGPENLTNSESEDLWFRWRKNKCQPNFRRNVVPNSRESCGPYSIAEERLDPSKDGSFQTVIKMRPFIEASRFAIPSHVSRSNHDTITMVAITEDGRMAAGGSTNGLTYKVPGRVSDTAVPGAGTYVDSEVGGCGATGDGDIMMRFLPCYQAVESLRRGLSPKEAAEDAIERIRKKYPAFVGAIFVVKKGGEHAGATSNWVFQYSVRSGKSDSVEIFTVHQA